MDRTNSGFDGVLPSIPVQKLDELLRQKLGVSDPRDVDQLISALRRRYPQEAARLDQESAGFPISPTGAASPSFCPEVPSADAPEDRELRRVGDNLAADLQAVIDAPANREWRAELNGWRNVLLAELSDGTRAAAFAQDPAQRDRAMLAVRRLSQYARAARLAGVANAEVNSAYRRLATTLDDAAYVARMKVGRALYDAGLGDGGLVVQVPVADLRAGRDAVLLALQRLQGTAESAGDDTYGDGPYARLALDRGLEAHCARELRVYLREETLGGALDTLIAIVGRQDAEGLRELEGTAALGVSHLRRLQRLADQLLDFSSNGGGAVAGLSGFVQALQLFLRAFDSTRASARLVDLAVPLAMSARRTNTADAWGRKMLRRLVTIRGELSEAIEAFAPTVVRDDALQATQVQLDLTLYGLDLAIDLYAQGEGDAQSPGPGEKRAGVFGFVAQQMLGGVHGAKWPCATQLEDALQQMSKALQHRFLTQKDPIVLEVVLEQLRVESECMDLVNTIAPRCMPDDSMAAASMELLKRASGADKLQLDNPIVAPPADPRTTEQRIADLLERRLPNSNPNP